MIYQAVLSIDEMHLAEWMGTNPFVVNLLCRRES